MKAARYGVRPLIRMAISSTSGISVGQRSAKDWRSFGISSSVSPRRPKRLASKCTCMKTPKKCMNAGTAAAMMIVWYGTFRNSIIRNAAAPSTGGVICPPVEGQPPPRGEFALVAHADHRGNGERAHRHRIGHRRARQHAEHGRAEHADLGRPARVAAGHAGRDVQEQLAQADARGQHAEQHEVKHVGGHHAHRHAVDALAGEVLVVDELAPARACVLQQARKDRAEQGVDHEAEGDQRQGPAHAAPRGFEQRDEQDGAHHHVERAAGCRRERPCLQRSTGCRARWLRQPAPAASRPAARRRASSARWSARFLEQRISCPGTRGRSAPAQKPGARRGAWSRAAGQSPPCRNGSSDSMISKRADERGRGGRERPEPHLGIELLLKLSRVLLSGRVLRSWQGQGSCRTGGQKQGRAEGPPVSKKWMRQRLLQHAGFLVEALGTRMERNARALHGVFLGDELALGVAGSQRLLCCIAETAPW